MKEPGKEMVCRAAVLFLLSISLVLPSPAAGQRYPHSLFNGVDLSQWVKADGSPVDRGWVVDNGTLHRKERGGDIFYHQEVGDFELTFEFMISEQGNSGVKYRVKQYGNAWLGCEFQILDDAKKDAPKHVAGALYAVYEPVNKPPISPGQWHWVRIVVQNNRIEHWLNGHLVVNASVGGEDWQKRIQSSKFRGREKFGENRVGRIMLQDHGNKVWFRNLFLNRLDQHSVQPQIAETHSAPSAPACPCDAAGWQGPIWNSCDHRYLQPPVLCRPTRRPLFRNFRFHRSY